MKKGIARLTAFCLAAGFTFSQSGALTVVSAAETKKDDKCPEYGFAACEEYVNIRATADKDGELVGTIRNNGYMNIQSVDENGWYHITSGNVEGYIASQYVVTGDEADMLGEKVGYKTAEVGAESLNMRASASEESAVVGSVDESEKVEVVEDNGDWVKVVKDGTYGYVSTEYVYVSKEFTLAETPEEMQVRLGNEWAASQSYASETSAETSADTADYSSSDNASYVEPTYTETEAQYYEEPTYTETEAPSYEEPTYTETEAQYTEEPTYVETEAQYYEETEAPSYEETEAPSYEETEAPYYEETEAPYYEETEAPYYEETEAPYYEETEAYVEETEAPSYSSTGQAIADYACQFIGNPYVYGGTSLTNGADCSGFVMSVFANFGISLPHYSGSQMGYGTAVSASNLMPGDLVFYGAGGSQHVAIYIGGGAVVHAANSNSGIITSDMYWSGTPTGYRRLV